MKRLLTAAAVAAAALMASACVTVIGGDDDFAWTGDDAQPFDASRDACVARTGSNEGTTAFIDCMKEKGWTRVPN